MVKDGIGNHWNEWTEDYCCFATIGGGTCQFKGNGICRDCGGGLGMTVMVRFCEKVSRDPVCYPQDFVSWGDL